MRRKQPAPEKEKKRRKGNETQVCHENQPGGSGVKRSTKGPKLKINRDDPANFCGLCNGNYFDEVDDQDTEGWIQRLECPVWFHETFAGVYERIVYDFECSTCA